MTNMSPPFLTDWIHFRYTSSVPWYSSYNFSNVLSSGIVRYITFSFFRYFLILHQDLLLCLFVLTFCWIYSSYIFYRGARKSISSLVTIYIFWSIKGIIGWALRRIWNTFRKFLSHYISDILFSFNCLFYFFKRIFVCQFL